ncbi:MAG TPA: NAD(P)-binding protein [Candidatus Binataceae bacterium]
MTEAPIVIVGTGFAGFGAGHRLESAGRPYVVYDRNAFIGGHTASHELPGGFVFDEEPHISFAKDERIQQILADAVCGRYEAVQIGGQLLAGGSHPDPGARADRGDEIRLSVDPSLELERRGHAATESDPILGRRFVVPIPKVEVL